MVLVTGATGLVGSYLLLELVKSHDTIVALKRNGSSILYVEKLFKYYNKEELLKNIEWVNGDILEVDLLEEVMEKVDHVYHCAAMVSFSPQDSTRIMKTNVEGTINVVNACLHKNVSKLCYVSSTAAIGKNINGEINTESTEWHKKGASQYSISKYQAEMEVWRGHAEGLDVVVVNPSIIIGSGKWGKSSTSIFKQVWKGLKFYPLGANSFVDVRDVASIMRQLMQSDISGERFILTSENWAFKKFFDRISFHMGKKPPKIKTGKMITEIVWRFEKIVSHVLKKTPMITKETAKTSQSVQRFSNKKIKQTFGIDFIPLEKSIEESCKKFLLDVKA